MDLDWSGRKAVVIESDDWGLCAWSADLEAFRALQTLPQFRGAAGRRYGASTLESAADVERIATILAEMKGGDGISPVLQANTVMAGPDYARLLPPAFACDALPLGESPDGAGRWARPGLAAAVDRAMESGVWWPELHGLHHLPETAWLAALRRGEDDARRAFDLESPVCDAVAASGEYDPSEPRDVRRKNLESSVARFRFRFGRTPGSFCPPDYRWDETTEEDAERLGITAFQGRPERASGPLPQVRHFLGKFGFPKIEGARFYLPARIAFEPDAADDADRLGVDAALNAIRAAWSRGQPAIVSTHRANYVQLDPARGAAALDRLRALLVRLAEERATFLTDAEVHALVTSGRSRRAVGSRGVVEREGAEAEWRPA